MKKLILYLLFPVTTLYTFFATSPVMVMGCGVVLIPTKQRLFVKTAIFNVKKKFLNPLSMSTWAKHKPDFYKSILEAAERCELWGMSIKQNYFTQLKLDFNSSKDI